MFETIFFLVFLSVFSTFEFSAISGSLEPSFSAPLQNITVTSGREARIPCMVENLQNYKVAWVHYGDRGSAVLSVSTHVLTTNRKVTVVSERDTWTLVIANASVADRGDYMCQISTVPPQKIYANLQVLVPPQITHPPVDITLDEGDNATLECGATGDPQPNITWRKEGETSPFKEELTEVEGSNLTIFFVTRATAGAFLCVASNGVPPAVSGRALLHINYSPIAVGSSESVTWAVVGGPANLKCRFHSHPRPQITWSLSGKPIRSGIKLDTKHTSNYETISKLIFDQVSRTDFGVYKCESKNEVGGSASSHQLIERVVTTTTTTTTSTAPSTVVTSTTREITTKSQISLVRGIEKVVGLEEFNQTKKEATFFKKTVEDAIFLVDGVDPNFKLPPKDATLNNKGGLKASSLNRFVQDSPFEKLFSFSSFSSDGTNPNVPSTTNIPGLCCLSFAITFWLKSSLTEL